MSLSTCQKTSSVPVKFCLDLLSGGQSTNARDNHWALLPLGRTHCTYCTIQPGERLNAFRAFLVSLESFETEVYHEARTSQRSKNYYGVVEHDKVWIHHFEKDVLEGKCLLELNPVLHNGTLNYNLVLLSNGLVEKTENLGSPSKKTAMEMTENLESPSKKLALKLENCSM